MAEDPSNPSWLSEPSGNPAYGQQPAQQKNDSEVARKRTIVRGVFRFLNMGVAVMMAATGAIGLASVEDIEHAGDIFVGLYMILFAAILFIFETIQVKPCDFPQKVYKRNFGFLYGVNGKAIFMIFIAFLNFGLSSPKDLALGTGIVLIALGAVQILVNLKWPEYMEDPNAKAQKFQQTMGYNNA